MLLVSYLSQNDTLCIGTAWSNRVSKELIVIPAKKSVTASVRSGPIIVEKYIDKKTAHDNKCLPGRNTNLKQKFDRVKQKFDFQSLSHIAALIWAALII